MLCAIAGIKSHKCVQYKSTSNLSSEAWLYGCISLSLAQACNHSSHGLSQSSTYMRVAIAKPRAGFHLMLRKSLCHSLVVPPCQGNLTLILSQMVIRLAGSQQEVHQTVPLTLKRKGAMEDIVPDV